MTNTETKKTVIVVTVEFVAGSEFTKEHFLLCFPDGRKVATAVSYPRLLWGCSELQIISVEEKAKMAYRLERVGFPTTLELALFCEEMVEGITLNVKMDRENQRTIINDKIVQVIKDFCAKNGLVAEKVLRNVYPLPTYHDDCGIYFSSVEKSTWSNYTKRRETNVFFKARTIQIPKEINDTWLKKFNQKMTEWVEATKARKEMENSEEAMTTAREKYALVAEKIQTELGLKDKAGITYDGETFGMRLTGLTEGQLTAISAVLARK